MSATCGLRVGRGHCFRPSGHDGRCRTPMGAIGPGRVLNKRDRVDSSAVYVGRPSPWGNPYPAGITRTRAEAIALFREYAVERLAREPGWLDPLHGERLICWCAPLPCHAEVLIELGA